MGGSFMLRLVLKVIFAIVCIALVVVVLMQKGRDSGLGALTGSSDTYWSKNKGRSREGMMIILTRVLAVIALILTAVLNITRF